MFDIDVHVLHLPEENQQWRKLCDHSLIGHPINVHHLPGIQGNLRLARYQGFSAGTSEFVSFVDPDDIVEPFTYAICLKYLRDNPHCCGVYTTCSTMDEHGNLIAKELHSRDPWSHENMRSHISLVHQITVMRREYVQKVLDEHFEHIPIDTLEMYYIYCALTKYGPWVNVPHIGYKWRWHRGGARLRTGFKSPTDYKAAIQRCHDMLR